MGTKLLGAIALMISAFAGILAHAEELAVGDTVSTESALFCASEETAKRLAAEEGGKDALVSAVQNGECELARATFKIVRIAAVLNVNGESITIIEIDAGLPLHLFAFTKQTIVVAGLRI